MLDHHHCHCDSRSLCPVGGCVSCYPDPTCVIGGKDLFHRHIWHTKETAHAHAAPAPHFLNGTVRNTESRCRRRHLALVATVHLRPQDPPTCTRSAHRCHHALYRVPSSLFAPGQHGPQRGRQRPFAVCDARSRRFTRFPDNRGGRATDPISARRDCSNRTQHQVEAGNPATEVLFHVPAMYDSWPWPPYDLDPTATFYDPMRADATTSVGSRCWPPWDVSHETP